MTTNRERPQQGTAVAVGSQRGQRAAAWISRGLHRLVPILVFIAIGAIVVLVASCATDLVTHPLGSGGRSAHIDLQFRGATTIFSDGRKIALGDLRNSLWRDVGFAAAYGILLSLACWLVPKPEHHDPKLLALGEGLRWAPLAAAAADLVENLLQRIDVNERLAEPTELSNGHLVSIFEIDHEWIRNLVTAFALLKWAALLGSVVLVLWWGTNKAVWRPKGDARNHRDQLGPPSGIALALSGGGIRSAGFSLGALLALEERPQLLRQVKTITAVSGGNYAVTGWLMHRLDSPATPAARRMIHSLLDEKDEDAILPSADGRCAPLDPPPATAIRSKGRHRYLANGPGGLPWAFLWTVLAVLATVVQVLAVLVLIGWSLGKLLVSDAVHPRIVRVDEEKATWMLHVADRHWQPALILIGLAVLVGLGGSMFRRSIRPSLNIAMVMAGVGVVALLGMVVGPWLLVEVTGSSERDDLFTVGGVSLLTVAGALLRIAQNPVRRNAPRLGGVGLAIIALVVLGKVVHDTALGTGVFSKGWVPFTALAIALTAAFVADTQSLSMRELYRARLTNSFVPERRRPKSIWKRRRVSTSEPVGATWADLRSHLDRDLPELVVCCAASRVGLAPNGLPAESFTISPRVVTHHQSKGTVSVSTEHYTKQLRSFALQPLQGPAGWMATSGAAFASAMGGAGLGTTNALMAALNADLGIWLPGPAAVRDGRTDFPAVGLGLLTNEIFGLYGDVDEQVFVSDGGHVENLGLVEALRLGHRRVVCFDASGDKPGSFTTLRSALRMADTVLHDNDRLWFDTKELDESLDPPESSVYVIKIHPWADRECPNRPCGHIVYAKLQNSLAHPGYIRRMSRRDRNFPYYSTANQLLDDQQFTFLVHVGYHTARRAFEVEAKLP